MNVSALLYGSSIFFILFLTDIEHYIEILQAAINFCILRKNGVTFYFEKCYTNSYTRWCRVGDAALQDYHFYVAD